MPIVLAPLNTDLRIVRILATDKLKKHLESLGITIDATIRILSQSGGNVICVVKEGRLALDHDIASKILVA
ncbi:feoA family protein [Coprobacillus sp. CAG:826]|jgi:ferrous iron transport protein A|nr:ferrous iron transport protein A [Coprobacillus sp.]CDD92493.1 feoA family protein [Coprobacillus sp. CAG:826]